MAKLKRRKKSMISWKPENIYYFKSGQYAGRSIPELMFEDYSYLQDEFRLIVTKHFKISLSRQQKMSLGDCLMLSKSIKDKSDLHRHLEFYLIAGEKIIPNKTGKIICPYCGKKEVRYFALINQYSCGFVVDPSLVFCKNKNCEKELKIRAYSRYQRPITRRSFKFSLFNVHSMYLDQDHYLFYKKHVKELFIKIFNLPSVLSPQVAYDFFLT